MGYLTIMEKFNLLLMLIKKYRKKVDLREDEISFDSFAKFPMFLMKLFFFDPREFPGAGSENLTVWDKIKNFTKKLCNWFSLIFLLVVAAQTLTFGIVHYDSERIEVIGRSVSDSSFFVMMFLKGLTLLLNKNEIWGVFLKLRIIFENRENGSDFSMKKYLDGYYQVVIIFSSACFLTNVTVFCSLDPLPNQRD